MRANNRPQPDYRSNKQALWCPIYGRAVLANGVDTRLKEIVLQTAAEFQATVIELEVMPDRVQLLCEVNPQFGIHRLVHHLKGRSSRLLRIEFPWLRSRLPTLWTHGYFVATIDAAALTIIKQFIENQQNV